MVATFVVEDGTGVAGANSYLTEADALQYHENIGTATALWSGLSSTLKQQALRDGTRYLDAKYGLRWRGRRADTDNVLDWPRSKVYDNSDFEILSTVVPQQVKDACAEAALRSTTATMSPDITSEGVITYERKKADGVGEKETHYRDGFSPYVTYTVVEQLLADVIERSGSRLGARA